ncbi:dihydropteroate synthase [Candidatus Saganbacteria bacterium]|nr:dihydropteroate synthase [Candidatus Saganbacteria bacterium]
MTARIIAINNLEEARAELSAIGVDPAGVRLMAPKAVFRLVKLKDLRPVAANIIKQEMLSFGAEAATAYGAIDHSVAATDLLIFGQLRHFNQLIEKLASHQFGLPQIAAELSRRLKQFDAIPSPLKIRDREFIFGRKTYIMGVVNVTPDSFSNGGQFFSPEAAVDQAKKILAAGADIIDIGGESTRPGAPPVEAAEEKRRILPVIRQLAQETKALISVDTSKAAVAQAALKSGAAMINDVTGLRGDPAMADVAAQAGAALCLMHMRGTPQTMQAAPVYDDVMGEIIGQLDGGLAIAAKAGILLDKIILDPGIGFGKTVDHNLIILARLKELKILGRPILVGTSNKSFIGAVLELPVAGRAEGTAATIALAIAQGADFVRVHDVEKMILAAKMTDAIVRRKNHDEKGQSEKKQ